MPSNMAAMRLIWLLTVFVTLVMSDVKSSPPATNCPAIQVTGSAKQQLSEGTYARMKHVCYDRPVYKQLDGKEYISYFKRGALIGWMIGPNRCRRYGSISAENVTAFSPDQVKGEWQEATAEDWAYNHDIQVTCQEGVRNRNTFSNNPQAGCPVVRLLGSRTQRDKEGRYRRTKNQCRGGRRVYAHEGGKYYLSFFYVDRETYGWIIGTDTCRYNGFVIVGDDKDHPDLNTAVWEEIVDRRWEYNQNIHLFCSSADNSTSDGTPQTILAEPRTRKIQTEGEPTSTLNEDLLAVGEVAGIWVGAILAVLSVVVAVIAIVQARKNNKLPFRSGESTA